MSLALTDAAGPFSPRIVQIGRVSCAVDYALSNCAVIEVDGGHVLIDTGPSVAAANVFREVLQPRGELKAVIYTHAHLDHILGGSVFHSRGVPIYAQERFLDEVRAQRALSTGMMERGAKQFGLHLGPDQAACGIGPPLTLDPVLPPLLLPTHTFRDELDLEIGGVRLQLRAAPGETHDHLFVWLPDDRILFAGDNLYKSFPNLAAIRGCTPRPVQGWIKSLDRIRRLQPAPEHVVFGHGEPVSGAAAIAELFTLYRDAIAFVHNSVVRQINQGATPDEMVRTIRLPAHLRDHPYLAETYGTLQMSIRGIYSGYIGAFDGNAVNLDPLPHRDLAARLIPQLGGRAEVVKLAEQALAKNDGRYAAWLADLLFVDDPNPQAKKLKCRTLLALADGATNPLFRNWYRHDAAVLDGTLPVEPARVDMQAVDVVPVEDIIAQFPCYIRADRAAKVNLSVAFVFTDTAKTFTFLIRRGVGEVIAEPFGEPDLVIRTTEHLFKRAFIVGDLSPLSRAYWNGIRFEAGSGPIAPFRVLRRLLVLKSCMSTL